MRYCPSMYEFVNCNAGDALGVITGPPPAALAKSRSLERSSSVSPLPHPERIIPATIKLICSSILLSSILQAHKTPCYYD